LADSTPSSSASATNTVPAGGPSTSYTFRGVKLKIPAGWRAVTVPNTYHLCILSPGAPQDADAQICEPYGVDLFVYDQEPDLWPSVSFLDDNAGWTSQPYCPVWGNPHDAAAGEITSVGPTKSTPTVSGRPARKSQWQVTCGKSPFTAQMWALPKDHVFVSAIGLKADYQAGLQSIVNSLDVSGHKVAGATPSGVAASAGDIAVTVNGLGAGQPVSTNGTPVTFTVTYRNTSRTDYPAVQPLVFTDVYPGTPDGQIPMNAGKLERQDNGNWVQAILSPGGGMDYAMSGKEAAFPLAPGASRTVTYRMTLTPADGPGSMPLRAKATLPYDGSSTWTQLGGANVQVTVVK
ncbi:hypothetical protein, partial [Streptomyces sp. FH025]|uniref:hypothetical protein n=1 Tax=Streptomyces sp. FH025 TaxID=2815937 RepID=UPI001AD02F4B|nr:hypothetical protein [Streptomyces sp. FH025]